MQDGEDQREERDHHLVVLEFLLHQSVDAGESLRRQRVYQGRQNVRCQVYVPVGLFPVGGFLGLLRVLVLAHQPIAVL